MGAFWIRRIELVATTSELVGHKAGIALDRDDIGRASLRRVCVASPISAEREQRSESDQSDFSAVATRVAIRIAGPRRKSRPIVIFDLRPSNRDMEPVSNRNCRASVADAVERATWYKSAIHTETA
jgi:hypothetical protein